MLFPGGFLRFAGGQVVAREPKAVLLVLLVVGSQVASAFLLSVRWVLARCRWPGRRAGTQNSAACFPSGPWPGFRPSFAFRQQLSAPCWKPGRREEAQKVRKRKNLSLKFEFLIFEIDENPPS